MQSGVSASKPAAVTSAPSSLICGREDSRSSCSSASKCVAVPCFACKGPSPSAGSEDIIDAALIATCTAAVETLHRTRALPPSPGTSLLSNRLKRISRAERPARDFKLSNRPKPKPKSRASKKMPHVRAQAPSRHSARLRIGRAFPMLRPCRSRQAARSPDQRAWHRRAG
jgi:hypothetical protein